MANDYNTERLFGELSIGDLFQTEGGTLMTKTEAHRAQVVDKPLFRFFNSATLVFVSHMADHLNDPVEGIEITKPAK